MFFPQTIQPSIFLYIYPSIQSFIFVSIHLPTNQPSIYIIHPTIQPSNHPTIHLFFFFLSIQPSIYIIITYMHPTIQLFSPIHLLFSCSSINSTIHLVVLISIHPTIHFFEALNHPFIFNIHSISNNVFYISIHFQPSILFSYSFSHPCFSIHPTIHL